MSLKVCGGFIGRSEHSSFHLHLSEGEKCYLFVHFRNPVIITLDGREILTEPDACIIYPPNTPQEYRATHSGFTNDYVKFIARGEDPAQDYSLPLMKIFYITPGYSMLEKISFITWALTDTLTDHSRETEQALRFILDELGRSMTLKDPKSKRDDLAMRRLEEIRDKVRAEPFSWNVEKMAADFYMTRSHFSVLYKKHFGITPGADLHNFTMHHAKRLLRETQLTVDQISEKCGYSSCENFIRSFKKYFGVTPLKYRRNVPENDSELFP